MTNKWFSYIKIDRQNGFVFASGISFNEFYNGIELKPPNLLLLEGYTLESILNKNLFLEHISSEKIEEFSKSNVYDLGNFCCMDFPEPIALSNVSNDELAEMLYFAHKGEPLKSFHINGLQNRFAYISHDDNWWAKVYMKNVEDYKAILNYKICKEIKGRKRTISPVQSEIMNQLFKMFEDGAVLDFENSTPWGVRVYPVGNIEMIDNIHLQLDKHRNIHDGVFLDYSIRKKCWAIY